jgi:hypothetical protein
MLPANHGHNIAAVLLLLQCELLDGGLDVLVATPGRLLSHLEKGSLKLQHTAALVMDEVDVLAGAMRQKETTLVALFSFFVLYYCACQVRHWSAPTGSASGNQQ